MSAMPLGGPSSSPWTCASKRPSAVLILSAYVGMQLRCAALDPQLTDCPPAVLLLPPGSLAGLCEQPRGGAEAGRADAFGAAAGLL